MSNPQSWILVAAVSAAATASAAGAAPARPSTPHPFVVEVTVAPAARAKLERMREKIRVSALFSGPPIPSREKLANEIGEIDLGVEDIELPAAGGRASFVGLVRNDRWTWVTQPQVLINVTSAFHGSEDNLLECGLFQDSFRVAQSKPIRISCKLLG